MWFTGNKKSISYPLRTLSYLIFRQQIFTIRFRDFVLRRMLEKSTYKVSINEQGYAEYTTSSEVCFQLVFLSCVSGKRILKGVVSKFQTLDMVLLSPGDKCSWESSFGEEIQIQIITFENTQSAKDFCQKIFSFETILEYPHPQINKALKYIQENFTNEKCSLENTAKHVGLSYNAFSRLFRKKMQTTYQDYVDKIRIDKAVCLMQRQKEEKISSIAFDCGFGTLSNFRRAFKKIHQTTPTAYRKSIARSLEIPNEYLL